MTAPPAAAASGINVGPRRDHGMQILTTASGKKFAHVEGATLKALQDTEKLRLRVRNLRNAVRGMNRALAKEKASRLDAERRIVELTIQLGRAPLGRDIGR